MCKTSCIQNIFLYKLYQFIIFFLNISLIFFFTRFVLSSTLASSLNIKSSFLSQFWYSPFNVSSMYLYTKQFSCPSLSSLSRPTLSTFLYNSSFASRDLYKSYVSKNCINSFDFTKQNERYSTVFFVVPCVKMNFCLFIPSINRVFCTTKTKQQNLSKINTKLCNKKIYDLPLSSSSLSASSFFSTAVVKPNILIGHGYDIHKLSSTNATGELIVGGIKIENKENIGLVAHSDGDVVMHCICDALFGALGKEDIGTNFPDNDIKWKNAPSDIFVKEAYKQAMNEGYSIVNVDINVILEKPKLRMYKHLMRTNVAKLLNIPYERVNIKARTHEGVDSTGKGESIQCHAILLLQRIKKCFLYDIVKSIFFLEYLPTKYFFAW